jgi:hypothetical protein
MGKQAELKTKVTDASVVDFLNAVADENKRADCFQILNLMERITHEKPKMWGSAIVGFGKYHYKYASGREGDWPITGFSPRKQNLTIYIMSGFYNNQDLLKELGKYKTSVGCLYIKKLADVDLKVLEQLIARSLKDLQKLYPSPTPADGKAGDKS